MKLNNKKKNIFVSFKPFVTHLKVFSHLLFYSASIENIFRRFPFMAAKNEI